MRIKGKFANTVTIISIIAKTIFLDIFMVVFLSKPE